MKSIIQNKNKLGFSLLEISVVLLIIGILLASVTAGRNLLKQSRLTSAKSLTNSSPVNSVGLFTPGGGLVLWLEPTLDKSIEEIYRYGGKTVGKWRNITNEFSGQAITSSGTPLYNSSGINHLPSITFNDSGSFDINSDLQKIAATNHFSIFTVTTRTGVGGNIISSTNNNFAISDSADYSDIYINGTSRVQIAAHELNKPTIDYVSFSTTGKNSAVAGVAYYRNKGVDMSSSAITATAAATGTNPNAAYTTPIATIASGILGGAHVGDISEVIIFNIPLTFSELNEVLNYLSTKYKINLEI
jgi:prepilin-type N-terminal cleavage/methylation domain-containing protein